jgi:hypothetical protein
VLARILQHLPLQERLGSASLVSRAWSAAAVAATVDVSKTVKSAAKAKRLLAWLRQHGKYVASIQVSVTAAAKGGPVNLQLPCPELLSVRTLELSGVKLLLDTGPPELNPFVLKDLKKIEAQEAAAAAVIPVPPPRRSCAYNPLRRLQQLRLVACRAPDGQLSSLSSASALTILHVHQVELTKGHSSNTPLDRSQTTDALRSIMWCMGRGGRSPPLVDLRLTEVSVAAGPVSLLSFRASAGPLDALSSLQRLQRLTVDRTVCRRLAPVSRFLPASLTHLDLDGIQVAPMKDEELAAAAWLTNLQHLQLVGREQEQVDGITDTCMFDPQLLSCWQHSLTHLSLHSVGVISYLDELHPERRGPRLPPEQMQAKQIERLLAAVGQLACLQHLELGDLRNTLGLGLVQLQSYSALTASSCLTALHLRSSEEEEGGARAPPLPLGALQHVFPAGRQLPRLRELVLAVDAWDDAELSYEWLPDQPCVSGADLSRIGACCPGLTSLTLSCVMLSDGSVAQGLAVLPRTLRELRVAGDGFGDGAAAAVAAAQLPQLRGLRWGSSSVTPEGLAKLSALTGLTWLSLPGGCPQLGVQEAVELRAAPLQAGQPSVSQQLAPLLTSWIMQYVARVQGVVAV